MRLSILRATDCGTAEESCKKALEKDGSELQGNPLRVSRLNYQLFVGNLDPNLPVEELQKAVEAYGTVHDVREVGNARYVANIPLGYYKPEGIRLCAY